MTINHCLHAFGEVGRHEDTEEVGVGVEGRVIEDFAIDLCVVFDEGELGVGH